MSWDIIISNKDKLSSLQVPLCLLPLGVLVRKESTPLANASNSGLIGAVPGAIAFD